MDGWVNYSEFSLLFTQSTARTHYVVYSQLIIFVCLQVERHGEHFYTVDQGHTRFETLIHFVDFHRLNKGSLPCLLVHECSRSGSKN